MTDSLTQEEFLVRFRDRSRPLLLALNSDIDQYRVKLKELIRTQQVLSDDEPDIDTGNLEIELIKKAIARLIILVYSEDNEKP
jgi:hypothetical protein